MYYWILGKTFKLRRLKIKLSLLINKLIDLLQSMNSRIAKLEANSCRADDVADNKHECNKNKKLLRFA